MEQAVETFLLFSRNNLKKKMNPFRDLIFFVNYIEKDLSKKQNSDNW